MRDVNSDDGAFPRSRFAPEARVVKLPEWRELPDGHGEMLTGEGRWKRVHPIHLRALEALRDGAVFEEAYERALRHADDALKPNHVRIYLRRFFFELHKAGHIHIPFEEPPEVFHGRYRRVKELGRGGIGVAHLCRDEGAGGRPVVVKHAWGYFSLPQRADRSMREEGATMKAFDHPGIVRFFDEFEERGLYHLVREFADGTPIAEARRSGALDDPARRRALAADLARIVAYVHARGHLFLDLTPGNFVLRADGSPLVIDVGVCKPHVDGRVELHGGVGSRGYAAPEVIGAQHATVRSDVYGFGCVYQYLLTGHTPAHRSSAAERAKALEAAGVAPAERALVAELCAEDPAARPASMDEVVARLEAL